MACENFSELVGLYQSQAGVVDSIWSYFATVTLAVLGFAVGTKAAIRDPKQARYIIGGGYLAFSIGSAVSLWNGQGVLLKFASLIGEDCPMTLSPLPYWAVGTFQVVVIAAMLLAIHFTYSDKEQL